MKATLSVIVLFLIITGLSIYSEYMRSNRDRYKQQAEQYQKSSDNLHDALEKYEAKDRELGYMQTTLMTTYGLSKYEANYYAIIYYDFSKKYDIPWEIYPAMVRVESNFDPSLISKSKAKGMTQVLEETAKQVCKEIEIPYRANKTLWNDLLNQIIGFTYLSEAIKEGDSLSIPHGIQVYLGGPDYGRKINHIETRKYVGEYNTSVGHEFKLLHFIHKGVKAKSKEL